MKNKSILFLLLIAGMIGACSLPVPQIEERPTPIFMEEPTLRPTQSEPAPQSDIPVKTAWKAVRDQRYGFGLAVPCWWLFTPIPADAIGGGAMTIRNYDEAYFNANSKKGFWDWPNGTLKVDVIVMEGVESSNSDIDGYLQFSDPTMETVVSIEAQRFGSKSGTIATLANVDNPNSPDIKVYFFRLAPDKLIMINPIPQSIIDTPDFQAILTSIVLAPEEQITLPTINPASPLIDAACAQ